MNLFETLGNALKPEDFDLPKYFKKTAQLSSFNNAVRFNMAIETLKSIGMDGETAEFLLDELGYTDQVVGQVLRKKLYEKDFLEGFQELEQYL
jgi:hypothetical protein